MDKVGAVAIGRNEGNRLKLCLTSLVKQTGSVVYVDSGSTDGSSTVAREIGADVVDLDLDAPFTAARARNAGLARLRQIAPDVSFVQFIDGDCELRDGWIAAALAEFDTDPKIAVVCGRRRERFPEATIWNGLTDEEWDAPLGQVKSCGGDALIRNEALADVDGYREDLIAGEEPEMCLRMRHKGWNIRRIADEMTWHDANLTRFSQWWQRCRRGGHAYAEAAALHGRSEDRSGVHETRRALIWGVGLPLVILGGFFLTPWALVLLGAWPAQIVRLMARGMSLRTATFLTIAKFPEAQGAIGYWIARLRGQKRRLIEYK